MKKQIRYIMIAGMLFAGVVAGMAEGRSVRQSVIADSTEFVVEDALLCRKDSAVEVAFQLNMAPKAVRPKYLQRIIPALVVGNDSVVLDSMEVIGKRKAQLLKRELVLAGFRDSTVWTENRLHNGDTIVYRTVLPYEEWMGQGAALLSVNCEREGCCHTEHIHTHTLLDSVMLDAPVLPDTFPTGYASQLATLYPFLKPIEEFTPYNPSMLVHRDPYMRIYFDLDRYEIRPELRNNAEMLDRMIDVVTRIYRHNPAEIARIEIIGFASHEGRLQHNIRLSGNRAKSLKKYLQQKTEVPDSIFLVSAGGEAWGALRDNVAQLDFPDRDSVLKIIDSDRNLDRRERRIRQMRGGKVYREQIRPHLPELRSAGNIRVYYRTLTDSVAMAINRSIHLIDCDSVADALVLLNRLPDDPRKYNTLGVAYQRTGDWALARDYFRKACDEGDDEAAENLRRMNAVLPSDPQDNPDKEDNVVE